MTARRPAFVRRTAALLALGSILATTLLTGTALAAPVSKPYHVDVETDSVAAGSHVTYTVRIYNDSGSPVIGSANYTINSAFSDLGNPAVSSGQATLSGNVIQLRKLNIAAGNSTAFTYTATAPCPATDPTSYANSINAKQSNDYKGTGNDFILDTTLPLPISDLDVAVTGDCQLAFAFDTNAGPADSQIKTNITTLTYDPAGAPFKVVLLDGAGHVATEVEGSVTLSIGHDAGCDLLPAPCASVLSGDKTEDLVAGVATFSRTPGTSNALTIDQSGLGYTLKASGGTGITLGESPEFNVQDVGKICENGPCTGQANGKQFTATYVLLAPNASAGDLLTVGVTTEVITCTSLGFVAHTDTVSTDFNGDGTKTLTMTFTNTNNEPKSSFRVCYSQPDPWVDRFGVTKSGSDESYLQDCSKTKPTANIAPCVISIDNDKKKIIEQVLLPAGDPRSKG